MREATSSQPATRRRRAAAHVGRIATPTLACACAAGALVLVACGRESPASRPTAPGPIELTGVITDEQVTISPREVGAGPVILRISNQTDRSHSITLDGATIRERVGPVNPLDTATIQKTLAPGDYRVRAGSRGQEKAPVPAAGELEIGAPRGSG